MLITEFEQKIKNEIDQDLSIRINPNADDIAGIYYKDFYMGIAVPSKEIHETPSEKYCDRMGHQYRSIEQAEGIIRGKITKFQDPEVMRVMTEKI
jgi:hypothetical protein